MRKLKTALSSFLSTFLSAWPEDDMRWRKNKICESYYICDVG
jgi:hypothetical protein